MPIAGKHLDPYQWGTIVGLHTAHRKLYEISENLDVPLYTLLDTCRKDKEQEQGVEK